MRCALTADKAIKSAYDKGSKDHRALWKARFEAQQRLDAVLARKAKWMQVADSLDELYEMQEELEAEEG
jgi:hypothetical protein